MDDEPTCIDTCYTIELYSAQRCIGYPQGTPIESMRLRGYQRFRILRTRWMSGGASPKVKDLTWRLIHFQQLWRRRRAFMRRVTAFVRRREIGQRTSHPA